MEKAAVLVDALPWLQRFHGKIVVIKYGVGMTDATVPLACQCRSERWLNTKLNRGSPRLA